MGLRQIKRHLVPEEQELLVQLVFFMGDWNIAKSVRCRIAENNIEVIRNICQELVSKNEKDQIEIAPGLEQPRPDVSGNGRSYKWEWCEMVFKSGICQSFKYLTTYTAYSARSAYTEEVFVATRATTSHRKYLFLIFFKKKGRTISCTFFSNFAPTAWFTHFPDDFNVNGNVVRGKHASFKLVVRNGFARIIEKVFFASGKLVPGTFWGFVPQRLFEQC